MTKKRIGAYVGIDPTAPSLHIGHLLPLMSLFWMYVHGFHAVTLVRRGLIKIFEAVLIIHSLVEQRHK